MMLLRVATAATLATAIPAALAAPADELDLSACADDLDRVRTHSDNAADKAREAENAQGEFTNDRDAYNRCRRHPDLYDTMDDGCRTAYNRATRSKDELEAAVGQLRDDLGDLETAINDVRPTRRHL